MRLRHYTLYILLLAVTFFGFNQKWGYMTGSAWWTHLSFHFCHANIFHLAANMLVVFILIFNRNDKLWMWPLSYVIASACSFLISTPKPTVGLSGLLFAYYGIIFMKDDAQWRPFLQTIIYMAVSCLFVSRMAVGLHFICLFTGVIVGFMISFHGKVERNTSLYESTLERKNERTKQPIH